MKLNPDCVRDILLFVENSDSLQIHFNDLCDGLTAYESKDIQYTCLKLKEAGYLTVVTKRYVNDDMDKVAIIKDIKFDGHNFLDSIRDVSTWDKVKAASKKAGISLSSVLQIANMAGNIASNVSKLI